MNIFPTERNDTKIVKSLLALLNRLQWAENEQCAKHLIYMWAGQYADAHRDTTRRNFLSAKQRGKTSDWSIFEGKPPMINQ